MKERKLRILFENISGGLVMAGKEPWRNGI
jgi:hypothetical protein